MSDDKPIEAEVVQPSQAIAIRQQSGALAAQSIEDLENAFAMAVKQRELLSEYIKKQLKPNKHFYSREGQKPSLTKEGAEIILLPHNLAPDYEILSGPDQPPENDKPYQITVKCTLRPKGNPTAFVGSAIGSAGSHHGFWGKYGDEKGKFVYKPRQPDRFLCHNATLKMAEKSAMIAATLNSTAGSEFFTQDMEPGSVQEEDTTQSRQNRSGRAETPPRSTTPATPKKAAPKMPTAETRAWMISKLKAGPDGPNRKSVIEYFEKLSQLIPGEPLEQLPLRFVAFSTQEINALVQCVANFADGGDAVRAFDPHDVEDKPYVPRGTKKPVEVPRETSDDSAEPPGGWQGAAGGAEDPGDSEGQPWRDVVVPIPNKGQKRDDYLKNPDTIGSLYDARHGDDEESQAKRQRLWGFVNHFEPKGWTKRSGEQMPPSKADIQFREALDAFADWFEKNHPDEKL